MTACMIGSKPSADTVEDLPTPPTQSQAAIPAVPFTMKCTFQPLTSLG